MIRHLSTDEVLALHQFVVERFGGDDGVRDLGLLDSALHRPQSGYYEDIADMACALFESLLMNHPFVDGNKRVAFFATDAFLRLNGWKLVVDAREANAFLRGLLERHQADFAHLAPWIRSSLARL